VQSSGFVFVRNILAALGVEHIMQPVVCFCGSGVGALPELFVLIVLRPPAGVALLESVGITDMVEK
jgi:3-mercaptopyruvate sulfurtransferase SseA